MSETEKADCRAQGALTDLIHGFIIGLDIENRSDEYRQQFWASLKSEMAFYVKDAN